MQPITRGENFLKQPYPLATMANNTTITIILVGSWPRSGEHSHLPGRPVPPRGRVRQSGVEQGHLRRWPDWPLVWPRGFPIVCPITVLWLTSDCPIIDLPIHWPVHDLSLTLVCLTYDGPLHWPMTDLWPLLRYITSKQKMYLFTKYKMLPKEIKSVSYWARRSPYLFYIQHK